MTDSDLWDRMQAEESARIDALDPQIAATKELLNAIAERWEDARLAKDVIKANILWDRIEQLRLELKNRRANAARVGQELQRAG